MSQTADIFQSGNSQAVRPPKEFRFDLDEVEISRDGDAAILRPTKTSAERKAMQTALAKIDDPTQVKLA